MKRDTRLIRSGRPRSGWINVPPTRGSTYVFESVAAWRETRVKRETQRLNSYGARGNDSTHALEDSIIELEGGCRACFFPTGQAAIAVTLLGLLSPSDHILVTDAVYEPVRKFCSEQLQRLNIAVTYYQGDGSDLEQKIQENTKVVYVECPGSLVYEMLDLRYVANLAHARGCLVVADNTWGSGWLYRPLELGADISIIAATKYLSGHSDVMMGVSVANTRAWPMLQKATTEFGQTVSADDAYLVSRGLRSLGARLRIHQKNVLDVAKWFETRPEIITIFCPALPSDQGHHHWLRDCGATNGLISVEFRKTISPELVDAMIDALALFGLGASWGGFESLVIPTNMQLARSLTDWSNRGSVVRFHIGMEDSADLIADLEQAFQRLSVA